MSAPATGSPATSPRVHFGLAARVLCLILAFVLVAEAVILMPLISNYRRNWLSNRLAAAYTAALVIEAAPDGVASETLKQRLLDSVGVRMIVLKTKDSRRLLAVADMPPNIDEMTDLREDGLLGSVTAVFRLFAADPNRIIDVRAAAPSMDAEFIEIAMDETPLRTALARYTTNIVLLSLAISLFAAALVLIALSVVVLSPVRRLTSNLMRFADDPEDTTRIIRPSGSTHEIGVAEHALADMQNALANELREKKRLAELGLAVAKIGHDLRNMLAAAQLISDRLVSATDPLVARHAPKLVATLDRAIRFCQTTLAYGRTIDEAPQIAPVDLRPIAIEALQTAIAGAKRPISPMFDFPPTLPADADSEQMFRVLNNLCRNAVEALDALDGANPLSPAILVSGFRDDAVVCLRVCDTGPGLPLLARENLFVAFQGSARAGGTGLGLAIAADLVHAHGGTIRVLDDELTQDFVEAWPGARFEIRLPATRAPF